MQARDLEAVVPEQHRALTVHAGAQQLAGGEHGRGLAEEVHGQRDGIDAQIHERPAAELRVERVGQLAGLPGASYFDEYWSLTKTARRVPSAGKASRIAATFGWNADT